MRHAITLDQVPRSIFIPGVELPSPLMPSSLLFVARGLDLLVARAVDQVRIPTLEEGEAYAEALHFLGTLDQVPCVAASLREGVSLPDGFELTAARGLFGRIDEALFGVAGRALAVAEWDRTHRFCGRCGAPTEQVSAERARRCPSCRIPFYPRIAPAVITLVQRDSEVLLARNASFPRPWFSALAGFVESGESLEEAVAREVREEVGVELSDIRYFGSQPWPFGRSLMIGFNARYAGGEICVDGAEIAEARWFRADALPQIPPKLSIARQLIDSWLEHQNRRP
jgi:NAD+ diphosphatase